MIREKKSLNPFLENLLFITIAILIAFFIRSYIIHPFLIPTASMEPTIKIGDNLLIEKVSYRFCSPKSGQIVIFDNPSGDGRIIIKRVIGVAGDHIEVTNDGHVIINEKPINEPYARYQDIGQSFNYDIPKGTVFVLGDNRGNSQDSRWFGPISENTIIGRAIFRHWPLNRFGYID
jgi:signal peptidase I